MSDNSWQPFWWDYRGLLDRHDVHGRTRLGTGHYLWQVLGGGMKRKCFEAKNFSYPTFFLQKKMTSLLNQGEQFFPNFYRPFCN
jgi:hypothetical protein